MLSQLIRVPSSFVNVAHFSGKEAEIYSEQVDLIYKLGTRSVLGSLINAVLVALVVWGEIPIGVLGGWLVAVLGISVIRTVVARLYAGFSSRESRPKFWANLHLAGTALSATAWGATPWLFFSYTDLLQEMFIIFVLAGMAAGSVAVLSVIWQSALLYVCVVISPLTAWLLIMGDERQHTMALMTVIFMLLIVSSAKRVNQLIVTSLKLRYQNNGLVREVSRKNQELLEKNEQLDLALKNAHAAADAKSEFLANMSHEMRTPLNGVIGMLELLDQSKLSPDQLEYLELAKRSGQSLREVIDTVLDYSKIEHGKVQVETVPFQIRDLMEGLADTFIPLANSKKLELLLFTNPEVPETIISDPAKIRQITTNLLSNALKFTSTGTVQISVGASVDTKSDQAMLRIAIRDTGIGISEERQRELFEAFYQVDASITRRFGGTGLGLAISKQLAKLLNGEIAVESAPAKGSVFVLSLPVRYSRSHAIPESAPESTVVVSCEDANARKVIEIYLKSINCRVVRFGDQIDQPNYILHYSAAPETRLRPALLELRSKSELPILVVSGLPGLAIREATHDIRLIQRLRKPLRISELRSAMNSDTKSDTPMNIPTIDLTTQSAEANQTQQFPIRALIVDDNQTNQFLAVRLLQRLGAACDTASNGIEALRSAQSKNYDIILMDCQMPLMDGFTATKEIRRLNTGSKSRVPIIAMTASALDEDRRRCIEAGMDDHLPKPIDRAGLQRILKNYCSETDP